MIGLKAMMNIIDNSGATLAECVHVLRYPTRQGHARVGDVVVCVVQRARPIPVITGPAGPQAASFTTPKVRKGEVRRAVIVRCRKEDRRPDGSMVRFDDNAAVLIDKKGEMIGTRIGGVVSADLRRKGWGKIASLAPKVV